MDNRVEQVKTLFEQAHRQYDYSAYEQYWEIICSLEKEGYKYEHSWGHYLHCPDGTLVTLDYWND